MSVLFIDKPKGITSFDVCYKLRKVLGTTKIGHTGTLDPNATGLMIILSDKDTKANQFLLSDYKEYIGTCLIGLETDTLDIDGEVINKRDVKMPFKDDLDVVFKSFVKTYDQIPPLTSAIKVKGKKLLDYKREGLEVDVKPRTVEIKELELLSINDSEFSFRCLVSSGTYVRTLLKDILDELNIIGTLKDLRRTRINEITIDDADKLDDVVNNSYHNHNLYDLLSKRYYAYNIDDQKPIYDGKPLKLDINNKEILIVNDNKCLAIYRKDNDIFRCVRGLF